MILLTGASGYLGQSLLPSLIRLGGRSSVITAGRQGRFYDRLLDLRAVSGYRQATEGVQTLIHCAGLAHNSGSSEDYERINVRGSLALADAAIASGVKRFIFISSMNVVSPVAHDPHQPVATMPCPASPYAASKWRAEEGLEALLGSSSCELHILRPALIYDRELTGNLANLASLAHLIPVRFPELGRRAMICREDLVRAIVMIVEQPFGALGIQRYGIWDGQSYSARRIANAVVGSRSLGLPNWLWRIAASARDISRRAPRGSTWSAIGEDHWVGDGSNMPLFSVSWQLESRFGADESHPVESGKS